MLALVNTPNGKAPVELRQVQEPEPGLHEALVAVQAFSLNRGELRSFRNNEEGWIPWPGHQWHCVATSSGRERSAGWRTYVTRRKWFSRPIQ
jgi:NADPH:quinone reductase-like Zn-dependent oxidoreductase